MDKRTGLWYAFRITIGISMLIFLLVTNASAIGQGFTVTSVSTSEVFTKNTDPGQVYWVINVQIDGGGQSITGTIDPSVIKNFMNGKVYTKKNFKIDIISVNEQVVYDISNEGKGIYRYELQSFDAPQSCLIICWRTGEPQQCSINTNWNLEFGRTYFGYTSKRYCVTKKQVGVKGVYQNPLLKFDAIIRLDLGDIVKEKTICSGSAIGCEGSSVSFDDVGTATWTGSLVTGEPAPNQDNFVAVNRLDSNRWQIVRKSDFESYLPSALDTDRALDTYQDLGKGWSDIAGAGINLNNLINSINIKTSDLLNTDTSFTSSPFTKDANNGKITVTLERKLTSQNIVFRIRADKVGIYIPSGQPKILDIKTNKFRSGETGSINIQVQNIGDAAGTFSAMLINCDPITQTTSSQTPRKTLQPGDVDTISMEVSGGNVAEDITKTCSIKVYDANDPSSETISDVTVQLERPRICVPNEIFADGNIIKRCNKDGTIIEIVENCQYGVEYDKEGTIICGEPDQSELLRTGFNETGLTPVVAGVCKIMDNVPNILSMIFPGPIGFLKQGCNMINNPAEFILNQLT